MQRDHLLKIGQAIVFDSICQAIAQEANMLSGVNRSVVCKAMLSAARVAAPAWAQCCGNKGMLMRKADWSGTL